MAGNELQKAIDELRARIMPENLPYLEAIHSAAACVLAEHRSLLMGVDVAAAALASARSLDGRVIGAEDDSATLVGQ